ncbi:uncharacterized protein Z518_01979 [Rhinocladiella mackenziei CBS 650.93]|uniref:N-acetyltransferase domain-containing protein n=1 Tax=Rhinocladiella mackenziei CBS 650.93 TaxID=1442369 RepID=A0A0D2IVT1_9EURO|nr:uncharacterized protein Z518_01979 [Rhinocladiella mackenziei CBS 650.93]KIX07326.1 hypothetical protein Z518_01979 [Rhinocladiella mackenziei CBS 650.93]
MEYSIAFRPAKQEEDDLLSRILANAFLPLWNHNWFHGVSEPLDPVTIGNFGSTPPPMTRHQNSRIRFYRSLIRLVRLLDGPVMVAEVSASENANDTAKEIGAVLLWLPPSKRLGPFDVLKLWQSGLLSLTLPWHYGPTGLYRIEMVFESNIQSMWAKTLPDLPPNGWKEQDCGFVQMLASNPKYAGKRFASALLKDQIEQHFAQYPDRPVILDTTTLQGIRAYEKLGFKLLSETPVNTKTDAKGIRLKADASEEVKRQARETCIQRVMVKLP